MIWQVKRGLHLQNMPFYIKFTQRNRNFTMKRIFAILISTILLSICYESNAQNKTYTQDSVYLVSNPQTARWSYIETDSKGKQISTIYNSVESIEGDAVNGNIKILVEEVPVGSPKDTTRSFNFYCFKDGEFMADMCSGFEEQLFDGELDSAIRKTIKEKYPDLTEEKKKGLWKSSFFQLPQLYILKK